jgi:exodeoxyribonuclease V alpha subunit
MTIADFLLSMDSFMLERISHIIIDDASMLDLPQAVAVLKKLTSEHKVVLVGDAAQLPPAGPGEVLSVLAERSEVPVTRLTKVFRQSDSSGIPAVTGAIREGEWPSLEKFSGKSQGVSLLMADSKSVGNRIFEAYEILGGPDVNEDVRIICPTNSDQHWGAAGLNRHLSTRYAGHGKHVQTGTRLRIGDLVMATQNNWAKGVMDGSLGKVVCHATECEITMAAKVDAPIPVILVEFDHGSVLIDEEDIKTLVWGYAITCHKAHGSQFRRVIMPVVKKTMLDRALIYTEITRGVDQVVLVGDELMMRQAVESKSTIHNRTVALDHILDNLYA